MFQSFTATTAPETGPARLQALRAEIAREGLIGMLVPRADLHQGEYVAACDERLAWLTGFTGSAGFCIVLPDVAGVFIDGRYRVQVRAQVADCFTPVHWPEVQPGPWIAQMQGEVAGRIGFDPWLHTKREIDGIRAALRDIPSVSINMPLGDFINPPGLGNPAALASTMPRARFVLPKAARAFARANAVLSGGTAVSRARSGRARPGRSPARRPAPAPPTPPPPHARHR